MRLHQLLLVALLSAAGPGAVPEFLSPVLCGPDLSEKLLKLQSGSGGVFGMMNELSFLRWADRLKFPQHDSEKQRRIFLNEAALITLIQHFCFKSSD